MTKVYEHTETKHCVEDRMTREEAFELFRKEFNSIKCMVYDDFMVYGDFEKRFAASTLETAQALIKRKHLPLKARIEYFITTCTLIIEGQR